MVNSLFWFRRDLRLEDHRALHTAAAMSDQLVAVFVVEPKRFGTAGPARRPFLLDCLEELDRSIAGGLHVIVGDPAEKLREAAAEFGATKIFATAEVSPAGAKRDRLAQNALRGTGIELSFIDSPYLNLPGRVLSGSDQPYKVFTPYWKAAALFGVEPPVERVETTWVPSRSPFDRAGLERLEVIVDPRVAAVEAPGPTSLLRGGERLALERLASFADRVDRYDEERNFPAKDVTSRLSADLHFGTLHPRTIIQEIGFSTKGRAAFIRQLYWREFYADIAHFNPQTLWEDLNPNFIATDHGDEAERRFVAWALGETGYPLVDAAMQQLLHEGYMHNRVRMLTASFLVKDLHLPWQWGAKWFLHRLVDGDSANNAHGWQWTAGVGTDASPYNRVFNPDLQAERFDAEQIYIRTWLGEQAAQPSMFSPLDQLSAPRSPIVDHAAERLEALRRLGEAKERGR
jgi:deoxyribodipyrimidine photo-lyase